MNNIMFQICSRIKANKYHNWLLSILTRLCLDGTFASVLLAFHSSQTRTQRARCRTTEQIVDIFQVRTTKPTYICMYVYVAQSEGHAGARATEQVTHQSELRRYCTLSGPRVYMWVCHVDCLQIWSVSARSGKNA